MDKRVTVLILGAIGFVCLMVASNYAQIQNASALNQGVAASASQTPEQPLSPTESFSQWLGDYWVREMPDTPYSGTISKLFTMEGKPSLRFELRKTDQNVNGNKRSAIDTVQREQPLEEHIYAFSTFLPDGGDEDYALDPAGSEILVQWQNVPDPGEDWKMPSLALHTDHDGNYTLSRVWDDAEISTDDDITKKGQLVYYNLGSWVKDKGKFVTWTFHTKWGWLASQKPLLEVYKDGVNILDLEGLPNTTNDKTGVYMKLGICKWDWAQPEDKSKLTKRVIYYNNISIN